MSNRCVPPELPIAAIDPPPRAGWGRVRTGVPSCCALRNSLLGRPGVLMVVPGCALLGLALSWVVAPTLAALATQRPGADVGTPGTAFLVLDLLLSVAAFQVACALAIRFAPGRRWPAACAVAAIGSVVFLDARGGIDGMAASDFPLWYEFFPSHVLAAALALWTSLPGPARRGLP